MGLKLMAEIGLDGSGFERGLHKMQHEATHSIKALAVEAFGIYGIEQAIAKTVETATELVNTSKRLDVTVEQLQLLKQAAKDGGTEMGSLASAMEKIDVARGKIMRGDKEGVKLLKDFERLGVSEKMLQTQTAATLLMGPISKTVKSENVENIALQLKEVLGKGMGQLIPVLKTDFDELGEKMHKLGSIMDTETAVKLKALGDNFELLKNIMAAQLGPVLLSLVEIIFTAIGKLKELGAYIGTLIANGVGKAAKDAAQYAGAKSIVTANDEMVYSDGTKRNPYSKEVYDKAKAYMEEYEDKQAEAGEAAIEEGKEWKESIDELRKKLKEESDAISHPKPIDPEDDDEKKAKAKRLKTIPSDALVKVGNFLGANGATISKVDQQKIALMKDHLKVLNKIEEKLPSSGGSFGTGFPV